MIDGDVLAGFGSANTGNQPPGGNGGFDMDAYLQEHELAVTVVKPWDKKPGAKLYVLAHCVFNPDHTSGSAAFTLVDGKPGYRCQHESCRGQKIKDVFAKFPPEKELDDEEEGSKERGSTADLLLEIATEATLFRTPDGIAFASVPVKGHAEIHPVASKGFRLWLQARFYQLHRRAPARNGLEDAVAQFHAQAIFDSRVAPVYTRVAPWESGIVIDLCNESREAVIISAEGWTVTAESPVYFRRFGHMQSLPNPTRGGDLTSLRRLINIGDDRNWVLALSWLVAACRPSGPYPLLILQGIQGSAKSTTSRLMRGLVDPSVCPVRSVPVSEDDLAIAAKNSQVLGFDNLSGIAPWLSDALCRLATAGGISKRALYTDDDEVVISVCRPVILNGIDQLAERPDLADRALMLNVPRIDENQRRDEGSIYAEYEAQRPMLLGALYDALSVALRRVHEVKLEALPRMADFALWAVAAERGFGFADGTFMNAYAGNRAEAVQETLDADLVGAAVQKLMEDTPEWHGTNTQLLEALNKLVGDQIPKDKKWPKTPRGLSSALKRLSAFLREAGIRVTPAEKASAGERILSLVYAAPFATATTATTATDQSDTDSNETFTAPIASGGCAVVAVEECAADEPPLAALASKSQTDNVLGQPVAVVAVVAVPDGIEEEELLSSHREPGEEICGECGDSNWRWQGRELICRQCGAQAA